MNVIRALQRTLDSLGLLGLELPVERWRRGRRRFALALGPRGTTGVCCAGRETRRRRRGRGVGRCHRVDHRAAFIVRSLRGFVDSNSGVRRRSRLHPSGFAHT